MLEMEQPVITLDRVQGMFMGVFLGDALGFPHEFRCNAGTIYTGKLEFAPFHTSRFQGKTEYPVGSISDDSEMSMALLRNLIKNKKYVKDEIILSYMAWANTSSALGKNTRALLKGIKTLRGYKNRIAKINELPEDQISQSNGSLMRASPLSLLSNDDDIITDTNITNPNSVNRDCSLVYIKSLKLALQGYDIKYIFENAKKIATTKEVIEVLQEVEEKKFRNLTINKGWILHGIYSAFFVCLYFEKLTDAAAWIINQRGCDSDTLCSISGAMIGAIFGLEKLKEEEQTKENIEILLEASRVSTRPALYKIDDFYEFTEQAHHIFCK